MPPGHGWSRSWARTRTALEIQEQFAELAGISIEPVGLMGRVRALDAAMKSSEPCRATYRAWSLIDHEPGCLRRRDREQPLLVDVSWDPALLPGLADEVRAWAQERFGPLDQVHGESYDIGWRAYDLVG
ncbi:MAG: hypothetical protein U0V56_05335 [Actinomycetota bacterium]